MAEIRDNDQDADILKGEQAPKKAGELKRFLSNFFSGTSRTSIDDAERLGLGDKGVGLDRDQLAQLMREQREPAALERRKTEAQTSAYESLSDERSARAEKIKKYGLYRAKNGSDPAYRMAVQKVNMGELTRDLPPDERRALIADEYEMLKELQMTGGRPFAGQKSGAAPAAGAVQYTQTATNPKTGQRIGKNPKTGAWEPIK